MQRRSNLGEPGAYDGGSRHEDQIPTRLEALVSQRLAQQPLGSISNDRAADFAPRHHSGPTGRRDLGWGGRRDDNDERVGVRSSFTPHPLDIGCAS